jgi:arylsulfatase A-like enzyme
VDESAYHVPLLIYAPRTPDHTEGIPWITSHIDLAPTVLELLGIASDQQSEQGSPIWNPGLADRTTFLLGQPTFSADGYVSQDHSYMWNYLSDSVYANSRAFFDLGDFVPTGSPVDLEVKANITMLLSIEGAWHARFAQLAKAKEKTVFASTVH